MKYDKRINDIEKKLPPGRHVVLMNVWNSDGTLRHTTGETNPTMTINVQGVKPDIIINHKPLSSEPVEKCEQ